MPAQDVLDSVELLVVRSDRPTLERMQSALRDYCALQGNALGGALKRVLYDGDTTLNGVLWCRDLATAQHDVNGQLLALLMLRLPESELEQLAAQTYWEANV